MNLYTAFIIGLVGSLHCIGMCGPIALILPGSTENKLAYFRGRLLYNGGRILTYGFMGLIVGFIGDKIILYGYQQVLSIATGLIILIFVIAPKNLPGITWSGNRLIGLMQERIRRLLKKSSGAALLSIGLLNGFLPCGLVYLALASAVSAGSAYNGMAVMILFGAGTLPLMFAVSFFIKYFPLSIRNKAARLVPWFALILALIFILRGLNLGIPYISPKLDKLAVHQQGCCTSNEN